MQFKTFGDWLRHQRLKKEISPFKMAEELGYKRVSAIYNFEYGIAPLPISKWPMLARLLHLSVAEFLGVMKRYFPAKAAEFQMIQKTASGAGEKKRPNTTEENPDFSLIPSGAVQVDGESVRTFQAADAEWVLVAQDHWEDSLIIAVDRLRRLKKMKAGLVQVPASGAFPSRGIVSWLKDARGICALESGDHAALANQIKAGFMDALTGAEGYPQVHRVPRVFSVFAGGKTDDWSPENLSELIKKIKENGNTRYLELRRKNSVADRLETR